MARPARGAADEAEPAHGAVPVGARAERTPELARERVAVDASELLEGCRRCRFARVGRQALTDELVAAAAIRSGAIVPLVLASLAIMGSPGPATVSLTASGSVFGVRRSLGYLAGIIAGTTIVLVAVATGITAALLALPALRPALIAVAAGYILWLAYHIATAPPLDVSTAAARAPTLAGGTFLGVANPKAWVAIAAVFAGTRVAGSAPVDATVKVAVLTLMIVVINSAWLLAGASLAPLLRHPRRARVVNVVLAVVLVATTALAVAH